MAVATTTTWTMTIDEIVDEAVQRVMGELASGYTARRAMRALNLLQQEFTTRGVNLWRLEEITQTLTAGTATYTLGTNVIDLFKDSAVIRQTGVTPVYDMSIPRIALNEYQALPNKTATGKPVQFWMNRLRAAPTVTFYPVPDVSTYQFRSWAITKFFDAALLSGDADIPTRWLTAMVSGLAWYIARGEPKTVSADRRLELKAEFDRDYEIAAKEDRDTSGLRVIPDLSVYARVS